MQKAIFSAHFDVFLCGRGMFQKVEIVEAFDLVSSSAYEKGVVHWAPDGDVNLCTTCGRGFSLTRRRHHCRLCGGIICNRCSQFLPFSYASTCGRVLTRVFTHQDVQLLSQDHIHLAEFDFETVQMIRQWSYSIYFHQ